MSDARAIGIVGGGLIGMSWASLFLARGRAVIVYDPDPATGAALAEFVEQAWPHLRALGLTTADQPAVARFTTKLGDLKDVEFVQENTPDRIKVKQAVMTELEQVIGEDVIIASSTSSLRASDIQADACVPGRILVAHPMNPPHLVPMVELVAGDATTEAAMQAAEAFYRDMRRVTIRVKKEVPGHLANRLTSALYREAVHLVAEGIADVADIDRAISYGPGMRWALMGPHLTYHLGGGAGGYRHYLDHLGPTQQARWDQLGAPTLDAELCDKLVAGLDRELTETDTETLVTRRDDALVALAALKDKYGF